MGENQTLREPYSTGIVERNTKEIHTEKEGIGKNPPSTKFYRKNETETQWDTTKRGLHWHITGPEKLC